MRDYIINELRNRGITLPECSQSRKLEKKKKKKNFEILLF